MPLWVCVCAAVYVCVAQMNSKQNNPLHNTVVNVDSNRQVPSLHSQPLRFLIIHAVLSISFGLRKH